MGFHNCHSSCWRQEDQESKVILSFIANWGQPRLYGHPFQRNKRGGKQSRKRRRKKKSRRRRKEEEREREKKGRNTGCTLWDKSLSFHNSFVGTPVSMVIMSRGGAFGKT